MKKLNVGMIGYKFMGRAHSNAWRQANVFFKLPGQAVLHSVCGRDARAVRLAAGEMGWVNAVTDWREIVQNPDIGIVDICTSNETHMEIALAAIRAGKSVLCEKPLALDAKQAKAMRDASEKSGNVHAVCHNYRRIPAIALAKQMIGKGLLGKIYHYRARYLQDWIVDPAFPLVWRLQGDLAGSGTHGDIQAHIIDLGRYLVGEIEEVCGMLETFIKERPLVGEEKSKKPKMAKVTVDDASLAIGRFANGALLNLEASRFALGRKNALQIEINGSKGSVYFDFEDMNRLKFYDDAEKSDRKGFRDILVTESTHPFAGAWWPPGHIIGYEHTFVHTVADFIAAVCNKKPMQPSFEDGYRNQVVLDTIQKSSETKKWMKVKF